MGGRFAIWLSLLLAAAPAGRALWAQGVAQSEKVSYAVTLVDAATKGEVSASTASVRVKVTVSVPRAAGAAYGAIPAYARPAGLMYRAHGASSTAWSRSIGLVRDAPYDLSGNPRANAFYPMPQKGATPDLTAVLSGQSANMAGAAYADYVKNGLPHDPARWEAVYLSSKAYSVDVTEEENSLVHSLLTGQATHEWYAASEYGLGAFARISPIQDPGRAMDFTDVRLWQGTKVYDDVTIDTASAATLGVYDDYTLRTMPEGAGLGDGWHVVRGAIGSNNGGQAGLQLFNAVPESEAYNTGAHVISPLYPDGIGSVSFDALATSADEAEDGSAQRLQLWVSSSATANRWTLLTTFDLTTGARPYSAEIAGEDGASLAPAGSNARFCLRRVTTRNGAGAANIATLVVRNLRVRSAQPAADFGAAAVATVGSASRPWAGEPFTVTFAATASEGAASLPRGYSATLKLRRRAEGDTTNAWRTAPLSVLGFSSVTGAAALRASFKPGTLATNDGDGSVNVTENAYFMDGGEVSGVLPGVYDLALDAKVFGSFKAGRDQMDEREAVAVTLEGIPYVGESGRTEVDPYLLDVRERRTLRESVSLRVMYRGRPDSGEGYAIRTVDIPCLPSSKGDCRWRAPVPKTLRLSDYGMEDDEAAIWAWGWQADETSAPVFTKDVLAFTVVAKEAGSAAETVYGQDGAAAAGVLPPVSEPVPAISQRLAAPGASEPVPVVVPLAELDQSHVLLEVDFSDAASPAVAICGAYHQDFNAWYAPNTFTASDFREDVTTVTADFDCTMTADGSQAVIASGWIPDEGPLADSTSFTETFDMARAAQTGSGLPFLLPRLSTQASSNFIMWGAAPEAAEPRYLREDGNAYNYNSLYMTMGYGTELVASRSYAPNATGRTYLPDAQVRLRGGRGMLSPYGGSGITLNGVGTVSFKLGLSLPYDILGIAQFRESNGSLLGDKWGVAAGVTFDSGSTGLNAASGYSVSYYLVDDNSGKKYELRLTQIRKFDDEKFNTGNEDAPESLVVGEFYEWTSGQTYPVRLPMVTAADGKDVAEGYRPVGTTLSQLRAALWVMSDGRLAAGWTNSLTGTPAVQIKTKTARVSVSSAALTPALGSAECRPVFRQIQFSTAVSATDAYPGSVVFPALDEMKLYQANDGTSWQLTSDASGASRIQIRRSTPSKDRAGRVRLEAYGSNKDAAVVSTTLSGERMSVTMAAPNGTLYIQPYETDSVFLDDLTITSWCGNDYNRNGDDRVPANTDVGFYQTNGFAGVGVWIRPTDDLQKGVAPLEYSGSQCVLLQRSRKNTTTSGYSAETATESDDGTLVSHTGGTLALYSPWSDSGFGTVSFKYRIPTLDEYGSGKQNPSVSLMLQYKNTYTANRTWLAGNAGTGWVNVSAPIVLDNTEGEWRSLSVTPKLGGVDMAGVTGNLRLVMVTTGLTATDDPYVYLDDLVFTDNIGSTASWSALNAKITDDPVALLYWKDRVATEGAVPEETHFAAHSSLTRGIQFNSVVDGLDTDGGPYGRASLTSPVLTEGVGTVTFAARRTEAGPTPVRVYLERSEDSNEDIDALTDWRAVTYVDVTNTVYQVFSVDLAKFTKTRTPLDPATLRPGTPAAGAEDYASAATRRLRLRTRLANDQIGNDEFGDAPQVGRVMLDALTISNPVGASLRVRTVMFANLAGTGAEGFERQIASLSSGEGLSPLAQPVSGATVLRAMAALDRMQQVKDGSVRVFLTYDSHTPGSTFLKRHTGGYSYDDVLGNEVSASSASPIYTWAAGEEEAWPVSAWFDLDAAKASVTEFGSTLPNTIELKAVSSDGAGSLFAGDLTPAGLTDLPSNSLVRYVAWAVYESDDEDADGRVYAARQEASGYAEYPWYFPRSLNAEVRARANAARAEGEAHGSAFFSPYFWVYSCLPGEVFLTEFDLADNSSSLAMRPFVEFCAPVQLDISGWRIVTTGTGNTSTVEEFAVSALTAAEGTRLPAPEQGVVPARRETGSSSNRAFYTAMTSASAGALYAVSGGTERALNAVEPNAGVVSTDFEGFTLGASTTAASVSLRRPTGGADHIVVFSNVRESSLGSTRATAQANLDALHARFQAAYASQGFGGEWRQAFIEENWDEVADFGDASVSVADHTRRLAKADVFPADANADYAAGGTETFVQDFAKTAYANSVATLDMGGKWVTRLNHVNTRTDGGPTDLSALVSYVPGVNFTQSARPGTTNVQVTPRQVNPDQYLLRYTGLNQNTVASTIAGLGTHTLDVYTVDGSGGYAIDRTRQAGREEEVAWAVSGTAPRVRITYAPVLFHTLGAVTLAIQDAKTGARVTDRAAIDAALSAEENASLNYSVADDGTVTFTPADPAAAYAVTVILSGGDDIRYNLAFGTAFSLDASRASGVLASATPYCGDAFPGTARQQPWWGSGFGFSLAYDPTEGTGGAYLTSAIVTYPAPTAPDYNGGRVDVLGKGLAGTWSGTALSDGGETYSLQGLEYSAATNLLSTVFAPVAGTRYVELKGASGGRVADASAVAILSDAYAAAAGYDGTAATASRKEPAIPYCVWGVYTVPVVSDTGSERLSFLVRQPALPAAPGFFAKPHRYEPLADLNEGRAGDAAASYFYLYSTPPQSAWLNELNLAKASAPGSATAANSAPYAEVVIPTLRAGILNATPPVAQVDAAGWEVRRYDASGAQTATVSLAGATLADSGSYSYRYATVPLAAETASRAAYVLHRPCGAAEGGVWTGVSASGGDKVAAPASLAENAWMIPAQDSPADAPVEGTGSYVVDGVTDSSVFAAGSVQLTGPLVWVDDYVQAVSSDARQRTQWVFLGETGGVDNEGVRPDTKPVWNQVTVTSALRNLIYGGTPCGYHTLGFFESASLSGAVGIDTTISETLSGPEWVFSGGGQKVFSYRPRSNYRFESLQVPQDLVGKIMLIGNDGALTADQVRTEVARLQARADAAATEADRQAIRQRDWIAMGGRASAEFRVETDAATGLPVSVPTGMVFFDPGHAEGTDSSGETITFGDLDNFVVTVVFAEEPASAQNAMVMAFGQGEIRAGAWLSTQTFFALDDSGDPVADKGGTAVAKPIWSDEAGDEDGNYANLHGWLHQPLLGERLGMAAVISPEDGLAGGSILDPYGELTATGASLRPFLVWTLIPRDRVPATLFSGGTETARTAFLRKWDLSQWIGQGGVLPTTGDRNPISFGNLRARLKNEVDTAAAGGSSAFCSAAGVIPMVYTGLYNGQDVGGVPVSGALAFRTVTTQAELDALALADPSSAAEATRLPYSYAIDMGDKELWQDGAVLRFAIVIADGDLVYDCQSISNFTSDALPAYCPWYVPDAQSNINRVTRAEQYGVSPFAWVYAIGQGDIWINEFRPFTVGAGAPAAFELGMKASDVTVDGADFVPSLTLDGWKLVAKAAPLPVPGDAEDTPMVWISSEDASGPLAGRSVELKGWVPFRRLRTATAEDLAVNPDYYALDYYCATTDATQGIFSDLSDLAYHPYDASDPDTLKTFQYLPMAKDLFPEDLEDRLMEDAAYANGVLYALQLVRANGVVADEVLFYRTARSESFYSPAASDEQNEAWAQWGYDRRLAKAVRMETAAAASAGTIRAVASPLPVVAGSGNLAATASAQFVRYAVSGGSVFDWFVDGSGERSHTLPGPNLIEDYYGHNYWQPYATYAPTAVSTAALSAQVLGGDAVLGLQAGALSATGRSVGAACAKGTAYALVVSGWDSRWFALEGVLKNGEPFEPAASSAQTYALRAGILSATETLTVDASVLDGDVDYVLAFAYTPDAARLAAAGDLGSDDDGFLAWLRNAAPDAILAQTAADGVTAAEKYWLGFPAADYDASEVALAVTGLDLQEETAIESARKLPALTVALTKRDGGEIRPVGELAGDGVVLLLGKTALDGEWRYLRLLVPADLDGESTLVLETDCRYFKAVLLSAKKAQSVNRAE